MIKLTQKSALTIRLASTPPEEQSTRFHHRTQSDKPSIINLPRIRLAERHRAHRWLSKLTISTGYRSDCIRDGEPARTDSIQSQQRRQTFSTNHPTKLIPSHSRPRVHASNQSFDQLPDSKQRTSYGRTQTSRSSKTRIRYQRWTDFEFKSSEESNQKKSSKTAELQ